MSVEKSHALHWEGSGELQFAIGFVGAVLTVEFSIGGEDIVEVADRDS
jgi:hypothetical protein